MEDSLEKYGLDLHCTMILEEYRDTHDSFVIMKKIVLQQLRNLLKENNLYVTALEARVKEEASLAGKLELKGAKYMTLGDITDILGARVITFYSDDVDKIAALIDKMFDIDWQCSVDKRKMHELDSFGYNSLHYVCRIPKKMYCDPQHPELNEYRFEIQMRTALQHVWATMYHDTGYKSGVEIPKEYIRNMNRLAGLLEMADEQFSAIRNHITDYRRQVQTLVSNGCFDEVPLNGDTFRSYLEMKPFDSILKKIAAINQAEIHNASAISYLPALTHLGFKTLGDIDKLIKEYGDDAYQLALYQIGNTDLDIISSTIALQDMLVVYILENGGGERGLEHFFELLNGPSSSHAARAKRLMETAQQLPFMNR